MLRISRSVKNKQVQTNTEVRTPPVDAPGRREDMCKNSGFLPPTEGALFAGAAFDQFVSNAVIGTVAQTYLSESSSVGVTQTGPFTVSTKVVKKGQYITIKITTSPAMAGRDRGSSPRGSIHAMRTTMDKAGRLVIPRSLRNRIGLAGGGEVELELDGAGVRIEPVAGADLREDGGLLFIPAAGTPINDTLVRELIDADRHGR